MRKLIPIALLTLAACGGPKAGPGPTPTPTPTPDPKLTCSASTRPGAPTPYQVQGDVLVLGQAPSSLSLKRLAAGPAGRPIYGTWQLTKESKAGLDLDAKMQVDPAKVTIISDCKYSDGRSAQARASSKAAITDTTVQLLDASEQKIPFVTEDPVDEEAQ